MQTANKPENNNNSHEAHPSLGKAPKTKEQTKEINYVVVELAGTECEHIVRECTSFKAACKWFNHQYRYGDAEECGALIMKRRKDGTLTTEF